MRCKIVNGRRVCRKVSYNPFKMWGSWVGAGIGFLISLNVIGTKICHILINQSEICMGSYVILTPLGFLLGWGIHSLIRRYK